MVQKKATKYLFYVLCGFIFSAQYEFETSLHIMYVYNFFVILSISFVDFIKKNQHSSTNIPVSSGTPNRSVN